jgi:uncharacterized protein (DUF697 family)
MTQPLNANAEATESSGPLDPAVRLARAEGIIHRNVLWAMGAGVVPLPIADLLAIIAVQVKMLKEMSDVYDVPFKEDLVKKLVASLLSGMGGVGVGAILGMSLAKFIPVIGTTLGVVAVPVVAGACTHATGRVFVMHFESGGTFLDFDPNKVRDYFKAEFDAAKEKVAKIQQDQPAEKPSRSKS